MTQVSIVCITVFSISLVRVVSFSLCNSRRVGIATARNRTLAKPETSVYALQGKRDPWNRIYVRIRRLAVATVVAKSHGIEMQIVDSGCKSRCTG